MLTLMKALTTALSNILILFLVEMPMFGWNFEVSALCDSEDEIWSRFVFELV